MSPVKTRTLLLGIRLVDSFFPSGGYAYSSGLEAAVQAGAVRDGDSLSHYAVAYLEGEIGRREAVATALAHSAVRAGRLADAVAVDGELDALLLCRETRLASRQMGRQVLRVAGGHAEAARPLRDYLAAVESGRAPGHYAVALGAALAVAGWEREPAVAAFLYQSAVGLVSAALKLLPVGQREGQRLLERWVPLIEDLARCAATRPRMAAWAPVQDIYAMRHAWLAVRLFRS